MVQPSTLLARESIFVPEKRDRVWGGMGSYCGGTGGLQLEYFTSPSTNICIHRMTACLFGPSIEYREAMRVWYAALRDIFSFEPPSYFSTLSHPYSSIYPSLVHHSRFTDRILVSPPPPLKLGRREAPMLPTIMFTHLIKTQFQEGGGSCMSICCFPLCSIRVQKE